MTRSLPPLPPQAKCTSCRGQATIRLPHHHTLFCPTCFEVFFKRGVTKAMRKFRLPHATPIMVAVSGGKDSLALWQVLSDLGYTTKGLHISLGIEDFTESSLAAVERFATARNLPWVRYTIQDTLGHSLDEIERHTRRSICSVCGFLKRQLLNRLTIGEGYSLLATGHNLDDEAGRLLGNMVRHRHQYLEKQSPFLPSTHPRLPAKAKPLYRLDSHEIRIYCALKGIQPVEGKCPFSRGATSHIFQEALEFLEDRMPGTKREFLFSFLRQRSDSAASVPFGTCRFCGEPTYSDLCSVCRLLDQMAAKTSPSLDGRGADGGGTQDSC